MTPQITPTAQLDEEGEAIELSNLNRSCLMVVSGKTRPREIVGMNSTVKAFKVTDPRPWRSRMTSCRWRR
jgi:hypothetical protein